MLKIDLRAIATIESSNNPKAFNKRSGARGLFQITTPCLMDYNRAHPRARYGTGDLFNPVVARVIADWYFHVQIPRLLAAFNVPLTVDNVLAAYNWGAGNLRKFYQVPSASMPDETVEYCQKYKDLTREDGAACIS